MAKHRFPAFKSDSPLALQYQREWAATIRAQGRNPHAHYPVAAAKGHKLPKRKPLTAGKRLWLEPSAYVPLDADYSYAAGTSYCQQNVTYVRFGRNGHGIIGVDRVAARAA